ncbi:MAG: hypothetical protein ACFFDT_12775 [Candidatus Hodarchaeota archaeon]
MEDKNKFWRNQIEAFKCENLEHLQDSLNEFYKDKFVIATQVFPLFKEGYDWVAIVYYKVKPGS